jgi:YfiH family protein
MSSKSPPVFRLLNEGSRRIGRFAPLEGVPGVLHAVTTRDGFDVARAAADKEAAAVEAAEILGVRAAAWCRQVHGDNVVVAGSSGCAGEADAILTREASLGVMAFSADCPLILAADTSGGVVGVAHTSWRSTVAGLAGKFIAAMMREGNCPSGELTACICPSAGACCYEVGQDVLDAAVAGIGEHAGRFFLRRNGKMHFDLWGANRDALLRAGLRAENIFGADTCTLCRNDLFPSYRKEADAAGRFVAVIARK